MIRGFDLIGLEALYVSVEIGIECLVHLGTVIVGGSLLLSLIKTCMP